MKLISCLAILTILGHSSSFSQKQNKIFDVHLHGDPKRQEQLEALKASIQKEKIFHVNAERFFGK